MSACNYDSDSDLIPVKLSKALSSQDEVNYNLTRVNPRMAESPPKPSKVDQIMQKMNELNITVNKKDYLTSSDQ